MALKLFKGRHQTKTYPETAELLKFGRQVCNVHNVPEVLDRLAEGMVAALKAAATDPRIPKEVLQKMKQKWNLGLAYATEARELRAPRPRVKK